ncbi:MAG: 3-deoxy-manno-octulosonate cytidylyltransferase (CMP-KDO synthetase) [Candidatus Saganbacteria bacterium]|uniref:3-deoxy-manno-octulosonate cytidylyltransferase (CMP-KDO synthetase) n=1 Tax=Candidatus Saganbacteria bacterium TaxID=2575572 RepID=A0A833NXN9_UNCSA|nr:MAG: 3-deoxy-manno-octulosonate cytidylyltransferase (CMP-KDO synthetase) [Candidatus Saganbacteria bacterium]
MRTLIVIPARLGSWRFPDKPLTMIEGLSMIEHVYRRSLLAKGINRVVLAVCEEKVLKAAEAFGAEVVMTSAECHSAIDRVADAAARLGYVSHEDILINVQGDEPVIPPPAIEMTIETLLDDKICECSNLIEEIKDPADLTNHHRIKAIISNNKRLIYLTRQEIPSSAFDIKKRAIFYRQTCVMAFRGDFLQKVSDIPQSKLELIEGIDMLRLIENDIPIASGVIAFSTQPVDTPEDIPKVIEILKNDQWFKHGYK